jgi:hypothetical protein
MPRIRRKSSLLVNIERKDRNDEDQYHILVAVVISYPTTPRAVIRQLEASAWGFRLGLLLFRVKRNHFTRDFSTRFYRVEM